jgi:hypothetical protein
MRVAVPLRPRRSSGTLLVEIFAGDYLMRRPIVLGALTAVVAALFGVSTALAQSAAGAPPNTDAGRQNAQLAQTSPVPLGYLAREAARRGVVDDLNLVALGLTPPRR